MRCASSASNTRPVSISSWARAAPTRRGSSHDVPMSHAESPMPDPQPPRFQARSADTDPEAEAVQLEPLRRAGPTRRAQMALELSALVISLAKAAYRRQMPGASETEIGLRFVELNYGRELAEAVRRHLAEREARGEPPPETTTE